MSDILIKNMEMPKACYWKETKDGCTHTCFLAGICRASSYTLGKYGVKPDSCPIKEVPTHGDLIDRNQLKDKIEYNHDDYTGWDYPIIDWDYIENAPTVIEASK